jgi:hypothetical protein
VTFLRTDDNSGLVMSTTTGSDGRFRSDGIPEGKYYVRATKDGFAPAYISAPLEVSSEHVADAGTLTLYPASAVLQVNAGGTVGAQFTNDRMIELDVLAFISNLTDMRVCEDKTFLGVTYQISRTPRACPGRLRMPMGCIRSTPSFAIRMASRALCFPPRLFSIALRRR